MDHDAAASLVGVFAIHTCSPDEAAAVRAHLDDCSKCSAEASHLREAAGWLLTGLGATAAPGELRTMVLEEAARDELR